MALDRTLPYSVYADDVGDIFYYQGGVYYRQDGSTVVNPLPATLAPAVFTSTNSPYPALSIDMTKGGAIRRGINLQNNFTDLVTFARADATSCATYFDSTGLLQTAAANVPRFDYDPATPLSTTGTELAPATPTDAMYAITQPTAGSVATVNGATRVNSTDGTLAQFQNNTNFWGGTSPVAGKTYKVSFALQVATGTCLLLQGISQTQYGAYAASGTYSAYIQCQSNSPLFIFKRQSGVTDFTVSNISVQEVTFAPKGLLIEESRTNSFIWSGDMTNAAWAKAACTVARTQIGIDGVANSANIITEDTSLTATVGATATAIAAGSTITLSVIAKAGNTPWIRLKFGEATGVDYVNAYFNLSTGVKGGVYAVGAATLGTNTMTALGGGWYRCAVTVLPNGTYTLPSMVVQSATGDNLGTRVSGATYIIHGCQVEVGAFPTSYIPTTTAAVTRAADSAGMTGTNFSSWWNASAGTFVAEANIQTSLVDLRVCMARNTGSTNSIALRKTAGNNAALLVRTPTNVDAVTGTFTTGIAKMAGAYDQVSTNAISLNGAAVGSTSSVALPVDINQFWLGSDGNGFVFLNGHIRRITYYGARVPDSVLKQLTA